MEMFYGLCRKHGDGDDDDVDVDVDAAISFLH